MPSSEALKLPNDYVDLAALRETSASQVVNVIGMVVDVSEARMCQGGNRDWMLNFNLLDRHSADAHGPDGILVRFFRSQEYLDDLPKVQNIGDVVLLRDMEMSMFSGRRLLLSKSRRKGSALVFARQKIPKPQFAITYMGGKETLPFHATRNHFGTPSVAEQRYIIDLNHEMEHDVESLVEAAALKAPKGAPRARQQSGDHTDGPPAKRQRLSHRLGPKFRLVEEMTFPGWADICGEVVKVFRTRYGDYDLYITDYTAHEQSRYYAPPEEADSGDIYRDGDQFGLIPGRKEWPGPWGRLVLKINVKPPHVHYIDENVREKDWVVLRNVKSRKAPDGTFEGDMWHDYQDRDKIGVSKVFSDSPVVQSALERKNRYWSDRQQVVKAAEDRTPQAKPQLGQQIDQSKTKLSKRGKKRLKAQRKAEAKQHADEESRDASGPNAVHDKIRCSHADVPLTRVRDIQDPENRLHADVRGTSGMQAVPFVNARYRARVRVVDYEPKALEDFAVLTEPDDRHATDEDTVLSYDSSLSRYEWYFTLLLENSDAPPGGKQQDHDQMWVHVHHDQAQFLLGNRMDDPDDLRANRTLLNKLRERLFVLWGNLEESQGEGLSNRPFECCIMEYGVEMDDDDPERQTSACGWKRMYGMFGTTIL